MGSTTKRLCDALLNADNIDSYFDNNADRIDIGVDLSEFLEEKLKESGLTRAELFARSSINPSYGYQLLSGLRSPVPAPALNGAVPADREARFEIGVGRHGGESCGADSAIAAPSRRTFAPQAATRSHIARTSVRSGISGTTSSPAVSREAAMTGSAAFFAG